MSKRYRYKHIMGLLASGALVGACSPVLASGFQNMEQNVTNLGTAYAGTASLAEDASTGFYNSAGLTRLCDEQIAVSAVAILPHSRLNVTSATSTFAPATNLGSGSTKFKGNAVIPGIHYMRRISNEWAFGLNIVSPFGLKTKYNLNEIARYKSTRTDLVAMDIAPSIAYDFCNGLSVGVGPDFVWARAKLDTQLAVPTGAVANLATDGFQENTASRWGLGGHIGILYEFDDCTRVGINYKSQVKIKARGTSTQFFPTLAATPTGQGVRADVTLPDTTVLSAYHAFDDCWAIMADIQYTHWQTFKNLTLRFDNGSRAIIRNNWKDSMRYALGGSYQWDECLRLRLGVAFDKSPVRDAFRNTRIPDADRTWLAIGAQYRLNKCLALELGYAHLFFKNVSINDGPAQIVNAPAGTPATVGRLQGRYKTHADLIGLQLTWDIA